MGLKIFNFRELLRSRKIALHEKFINKTRVTKDQENSAHCFGESYLTNHLAKFLQNRIKPSKVRALRVSTDYKLFYKKNR